MIADDFPRARSVPGVRAGLAGETGEGEDR
jgi:hypothetical protein